MAVTTSSSLPLKVPPRRSGVNGLADLFRYHGFWAIGVRLFRRMSFPAKAAVISAIFLVVLAQLTFSYLRSSSVAISMAHKELLGLEHLHHVFVLLDQSQKLRSLVVGANGNSTPQTQAALSATSAELATIEQRMAAQPELAEAAKFARDAFTPLAKPAGDMEESFTRIDEFVQQQMRLAASVLDWSSLAQDPDPDSYHLMLASTQEGLQAIRVLARMRDLGTAAIASGSLTPFQRRILQGDGYLMYSQLELLFARYERVVKLNPALATPLAFEEAFKPANAFMRAVRKSVRADGGEPAGDAKAFADAGEAAIQSLTTLAHRSHDALEGLVQSRIDGLRMARNAQLAFAAVCLLVAAYLFYCFYLVTRGGMHEVTRHIDAMAAGDLSTQPRPWGRDEAAELMLSISAMQNSLRVLVGQVRGCAEGIVSASTEVAAGAQDLSDRTEKAASSLQQTASSMEQIATTVKHTADRSVSLQPSARRTRAWPARVEK